MSLCRTTGLTIVTIYIFFMQTMFSLSDVRALCRTYPGLTKQQLELCYRNKDVTEAALEGLDLAIEECQLQFQWHRWNCSSLSSKRRNPHSSSVLKKGYKESAFAYALISAGVVHSIAKACSQGRLMSCGCDPNVKRISLKKFMEALEQADRKTIFNSLDNNVINESEHRRIERQNAITRWKWGGCSHNLDYGMEYSQLFLDSRETADDIQSQINLHNNHAGRMAVKRNMLIKCKCHGMSGSCQLKTCWKSASEFHVIGRTIKQQFRQALLVVQSNIGNGSPLITSNTRQRSRRKKINSKRKNRMRRKILLNQIQTIKQYNQFDMLNFETNGLWYYQRSPNFCERDPSADIPGTVGRKCNRTSNGHASCSSMCCGRGYNMVKQIRIESCDCKFIWCCKVVCKKCEYEEWISVCN